MPVSFAESSKSTEPYSELLLVNILLVRTFALTGWRLVGLFVGDVPVVEVASGSLSSC